MEEARRRHLPPFSSLSENAGQQYTEPQTRSGSMRNSPPQESIQALRKQLQSCEQNISVLQTEKERLRTLYEQLEIKSRVMNHELATLVEERNDLRQQATALSTQVEQLTNEKEHLQSQSQADAAQWQQILSMSSKLQSQGLEEARRFNSERETWKRERERLEQRFIGQQEGSLQRVNTRTSSVSSELRRSLTLSSISDDQLRQEAGNLRERCSELEEMLSAVVRESASIERTGNMLKEVKRRIGANKRRASSENVSD